MREYGKVSPSFWTGETGKAIKRKGKDAVIVALYLMTAPLSNWLGLYNQPFHYMVGDLGGDLDGATKGLQGCIEAGFCAYDWDTEIVWVYEMAGWQISKQLKASDNRCAGIQKDYDKLPKSPFLRPFFDKYQACFHMHSARGYLSPSEAKTGTGVSQEQEQELNRTLSPPTGVEVGTQVDLAGEVPTAASRKDVPFAKIVELYHAVLPMLPAVEKLTDKRRGYIRQRWAEDLPTLDAWSRYFEDVAKSRFLTGQAQGINGRPPFMANLEWLCNPSNFTKVAEGNYHR